MAINLSADYVNVELCKEGIDVNKTNNLKQCMVFHYWSFLNSGYKYEPEVCIDCHYISMMANELKNIAIVTIKMLITDALYGIWVKAMQFIGYVILN